MTVTIDTIAGICLGVEYIPPFDDNPRSIIVDLLMIRFLIQW